jgi:signal transduction histidine kinase
MTPEVTRTPADDALEYAESIINTVREPLISLDQDLRVVTASRSFYEVFKVKPEETVGQLIYDLGNKQWDIPKLRELLETILPQKATFDNYEVEHDILNFASIIGTLTPPGTTMTAETHSLTARITAQCRVMKKIIEDFLDFQALEDGQIKLPLEAVDLNELARDVLERNAGYAAKKSITPHLDLERGSLLVNADKSRLNQVLENFVSNAIKFSPQGKEVTVCTRKTEHSVLVEVRDSGPGLTDEDMKKLFVKYAKLSNTPTGDEKSSGLGLAIRKKVVEMQGGKTRARNNPGGGATFWFELPG